MMIVDAHAVIDPRAVMIKAFHALVTDAAVTRSLCPYNLAIRAEQDRVEIFHHGLHSILIRLD
jgi:hypothetical protein